MITCNAVARVQVIAELGDAKVGQKAEIEITMLLKHGAMQKHAMQTTLATHCRLSALSEVLRGNQRPGEAAQLFAKRRNLNHQRKFRSEEGAVPSLVEGEEHVDLSVAGARRAPRLKTSGSET